MITQSIVSGIKKVYTIKKMNEIELKNQIQSNGKLPKHIAIIMDGNGRWAKSRNLSRIEGHREGINSVREITRECGELDVEYLTLYTFSIENWRRPVLEVSALMNLLVDTIRKEIDDLMGNNVKLKIIGRLNGLPQKPREELISGMERLSNNSGLTLVLALNYGGRTEIVDAVKGMCIDIEKGNITTNDLTEEKFSEYLYTDGIPEPDLLIRTSGEYRISNFLLWQLAYSEIYFTEEFWPAFRQKQLYEAILDYQQRERRFGKVME